MNGEPNMPRRYVSRGIGAAAAVLAIGAALTACSAAAPSPVKSHTAEAAVPGLPSGVVQATALPTDIPNDPKTRAKVKLLECAATKDGWKASGTVSNPGKGASKMVLTVFFTTDKATVIGTAQTRIEIKPGDKRTWSAQAHFTAPTRTLCVLRGAAAVS
jgi:hypothetical protein